MAGVAVSEGGGEGVVRPGGPEAEPRRAVGQLALLARRVWALWLLAATFTAVAAVLAVRRVYLHDEGVFTYDFARVAARAPQAVLTLLKAKPVLVAVYALPAQLGYVGFVIVHAIAGGAAVVLVGLTARRLDIAHPNAAALALAAGAGHLIASSNGYPNSDGALALAALLYLSASGRHRAAAIVAGALPLVRHELAVVGAALWAADLYRRRDVRTSAWAALVPALLWIAGTAYHGSALWWLELFPSPRDMPEHIAVRPTRLPDPSVLPRMASFVARSVAVNGGVMGLFALTGFRGGRDARLLYAITGGALALLVVLGLFGVFGFAMELRYHGAFLPLIALLAARGLAGGSRLHAIVALMAAPLLALPGGATPAVAAGAAAVVLVLAVRRDPWTRGWARALVAGVAVLYAAAILTTTDVERAQHEESHRVLAAVAEHPLFVGQRIYTDRHPARFDTCAGPFEVWAVANAGIQWEMSHFLDHDNGQYGAVVDGLAAERFLIEPRGQEVDRAALYVLRDEPRTREWREVLEVAGATHGRLPSGEHIFAWP